MRYLTTVVGSFHGRVVAARLGAEGVLVQLRGVSDGPYPLQSAVEVYVTADQLDLAREILLADAVDEAFASLESPEDPDSPDDPDGALCGGARHGRHGRDRRLPRPALAGPSSRSGRGQRLGGAVTIVAIGLVAVLVLAGMVAGLY